MPLLSILQEHSGTFAGGHCTGSREVITEGTGSPEQTGAMVCRGMMGWSREDSWRLRGGVSPCGPEPWKDGSGGGTYPGSLPQHRGSPETVLKCLGPSCSLYKRLRGSGSAAAYSGLGKCFIFTVGAPWLLCVLPARRPSVTFIFPLAFAFGCFPSRE